MISTKKAQVSIEILILIGIIIIASILFGIMYLSNINKNTKDATSISDDTNNSINKWTGKNTNQDYSSPICNNNIVEHPEECDGLDLGVYTNKTCAYFELGAGNLYCNNCKISTADCSGALTGTCGDGIKNQAIEECDDLDFGSLSCVFFGFSSGSLSCINCKIDTSFCLN